MSLSSGSYIVSQATLVGLINRRLLFLLLYFNAAVFSGKSKRSYDADAPVLENVYLLLDK